MFEPLQPIYTYRALVTAVHDGDTYNVDVDLGFSVHVQTIVRLYGCNCIELADPGGIETQAYVAGLLTGRQVLLTTVKPDKFGGRYDAHVTLPDSQDLTAKLIIEGWAVGWNGRGPKPVPAWPLQPPLARPVLTGP